MVQKAKQGNGDSRKNTNNTACSDSIEGSVLEKIHTTEKKVHDIGMRLLKLENENLRRGVEKKKTLYTPTKITNTDLSNLRERKNLILVLDTNVVMVDGSLRCFKEHDVYVLQEVRGELDGLKSGKNNNPVGREKAFKARNALKELHSIVGNVSLENLTKGVRMYVSGLSRNDSLARLGRLFIELPLSSHQKAIKAEIWDHYGEFLSKEIPDHRILVSVLMLMYTQTKKRSKRKTVVFVSNDTGCRLLASQLGIICEEFKHDELNEANLYSHELVLPESFWNKQRDIRYDNSTNVTSFQLRGSELSKVYPGTFLQITKGEKARRLRIVQKPSPQIATVQYVKPKVALGLKERSVEQMYALDVLHDTSLQVVNITGKAGTGKTLLALASGISQVLDGVYEKVIITREVVPLGKEVGYLPGTEYKKLRAWHEGIYDNVVELYRIYSECGKVNLSMKDFEKSIEIIDSTTVRGRSIHRCFVIYDECQNNTSHQQKAIASRIGEGSKLVCCGNLAQIDIKIPKKETGIARMVLVYKETAIASSVHLVSNERSETSEIAETL